MENLLLPRRERLFNNGGKLHFQNFSALFQGVLSTSFPSGKYHCNAISLRKQYHRRRHIAPSAHRFCQRQKHRFIAFTMYPLLCSSQWHIALRIIKNLTKSTRLGAKYSFLKTARMRRTTSLLKSRYRERYRSLLYSCAPSPHGYTVSRGVP